MSKLELLRMTMRCGLKLWKVVPTINQKPRLSHFLSCLHFCDFIKVENAQKRLEKN